MSARWPIDLRAGRRPPTLLDRSVPRRLAILLVTLVATEVPLAATGASPVVGVVRSADLQVYDAVIGGLREGLPEVGLDLVTLGAGADDDTERLHRLRLRAPPVIVALGSRAADRAAAVLSDTPVVFVRVLWPERYGLEPERVTGVRLEVPVDQQVELLTRVFPRRRRLGILYDPGHTEALARAVDRAARARGIATVLEAAAGTAEVPAALARIRGRVDALWVPPDPTWIDVSVWPVLLDQARVDDIPTLVSSAELVAEGATLALFPDDRRMGRQAAALVRSILAGTSPGTIPVQEPATGVAVDAASLRRLGVPADAAIFAAADRVINGGGRTGDVTSGGSMSGRPRAREEVP